MRNELTLEQWNRLAEEHNLLLGEVADLRAKLAVVSKERDIAWRDKLMLMNERDELRALLREARDIMEEADIYFPLSIDAALKASPSDR